MKNFTLSIDLLKKHADLLIKNLTPYFPDKKLLHNDALNIMSAVYGFKDYHQAKIELEKNAIPQLLKKFVENEIKGAGGTTFNQEWLQCFVLDADLDEKEISSLMSLLPTIDIGIPKYSNLKKPFSGFLKQTFKVDATVQSWDSSDDSKPSLLLNESSKEYNTFKDFYYDIPNLLPKEALFENVHFENKIIIEFENGKKSYVITWGSKLLNITLMVES